MDAVLVLLLLAVIWAVVLVPPWLQARREALPAASIRSFHRQLWSLGQAAPGYRAVPIGSHVRPLAHDVAGPGGAGWPRLYDYEDESYGDEDLDLDLDEAVYGDDAYATYDDAWEGEAWDAEAAAVAVDPDGRWAARWDPVVASARSARLGRPVRAGLSEGAALRRAEGYRRRRQVLATLLVASAVTAVPAVVLGGTVWVTASVVTSLLVVAYLALLVRRQRRTQERAEKVHYLAPIVAPRPAVVVLHGGAAH